MKRKIVVCLFACLALLGLVSCKKTQDTAANGEDSSQSVSEAPISETLPSSSEEDASLEDASDWVIDGTDIPGQEPKMAVEYMDAYTDFSLSLLQKTAKEGENSMISPLSAAMALLLAENGAKGETLTQMQQLFGGLNLEDQNKNLTHFADSLVNNDVARLRQANAIWLNENNDFSVNQEYLSQMQKEFTAEVKQEPFTTETADTINAWVEQKTDGKIKNLVREIKKEDQAFLINALSFQAEWMTPYTAYDVVDGEFHAADGTTQPASMLCGMEQGYLENDIATGFLKPYRDGYRFLALLPKEGIDMETFLNQMTGKKFTALLQNVNAWESVSTQMPKFTASYRVVLNDCLKEMGMEDAFDGEKADFSGLGTCGGGNLYISKILQETDITVNETGTEAAAATEIEMTETTAMVVPKEVILDRPFVYAIVDEKTELPIFMGVMNQIES